MLYNAKDLTGQRFGKLTVLEKTGLRENKGVVWRCRCDCGNEVMVNTARLNNGTVKNCGCDRDRRQETIDGRYGVKLDLAGKRFGMLTVLEPTHQRQAGGVMWRCRCDCGKETLVARNALTHNMAKSCGCAKYKRSEKKSKDLTGQKFGKLTAIRPTEERKNNSVVWECKCDCGNTRYVPVPKLTSGKVKSCGCTISYKLAYAECIYKIQNYTDKDTFVSDLCSSTTFGGKPEDIVAQLSKIWDAYHRPMKEIAKEAGLSQRKLAERFCIPYPTMEKWCAGDRVPPDYVRMMMQECLGLL